eukprot:363284-Chlamydomonas_euryale.AAC.7
MLGSGHMLLSSCTDVRIARVTVRAEPSYKEGGRQALASYWQNRWPNGYYDDRQARTSQRGARGSPMGVPKNPAGCVKWKGTAARCNCGVFKGLAHS